MELLPCAFCGGEAKFCAYPDKPTFLWIGCTSCEIRTEGYNWFYGDEETAKNHLVSVWNYRDNQEE